MNKNFKGIYIKISTMSRLRAYGHFRETDDELVNRLLDELEDARVDPGGGPGQQLVPGVVDLLDRDPGSLSADEIHRLATHYNSQQDRMKAIAKK